MIPEASIPPRDAPGGQDRSPTKPGSAATAIEPAPPARSKAAERQRIYRHRIKDDLKVVKIEVGYDVVDGLVDGGWLAQSGDEDREEIGEAIGEFLRDAF